MGEASLINILWVSLLFANFMAGNLSPDVIYVEITAVSSSVRNIVWS